MSPKAKVSEENIQTMRAIVGSGASDMELIRCLHLARNDVPLALNIFFDNPVSRTMEVCKNFQMLSSGSCVNVEESQIQDAEGKGCVMGTARMQKHEQIDNQLVASPMLPGTTNRGGDIVRSSMETLEDTLVSVDNMFAEVDAQINTPEGLKVVHLTSSTASADWLFLGEVDVVGFSTCKGAKLKEHEPVSFTFPRTPTQSIKTGVRSWGRGRPPAVSNSEIVRFSTNVSGEIGRLPGEWGRCVVPLVAANKLKLEGFCKNTGDVLSLIDNIPLSVKVYGHSSLFKTAKGQRAPLSISAADRTVHPLPTLFHLLGLKPFKKAEFTPEDLYSRKRSLESEGSGISLLSAEKRLKLVSGPSEQSEEQGDEFLSDGEVDRLVGTADARLLPEMQPPPTLACSLRPYQKQALHWMHKMESGLAVEEASRTLHPCWDAYHLPDKRIETVYVNTFSGEASVEFPSALEMARGGILADAMGLGKTVMTISLLLSNLGKGGSCCQADSNATIGEFSGFLQSGEGDVNPFFASSQMKAKLKSGIRSNVRKGGGTLIVSPMTLLGQWKNELETHTLPGTLTSYTHYGSNRTKDYRTLLDYDVVLTTYGVLGSEFEGNESDGPLHSVHWYRVVLDEAHTIKASKGQSAQAAFNLTADHRWCLTGTPIQNKLEDVFSLLHFLRVEPWSNWAWWNKLVQKPFEDGDERGLRILQAILQPLMLRRTKDSLDREGRPILELPPSEATIIECELSEPERDFYDALFKKSKVKFDKFVEQGRVLHNYASILELLLRLRQCCDHPFLVLSRGDTEEYADMQKLAKRLISGRKGNQALPPGVAPSRAYVQEVIEDLQKNDKAECPICLEAMEDTVLTPCAHRMCRECLLASWNGGLGGACPICRQVMGRHDVITAPTDNRFQIDVEKNWTESSKVAALMQELEILQSSMTKSVVFSQWTAFLDLLEIPLQRKKVKYVRLDGTLSQQQREIVLHDFKSDPSIEVLLLSLKAGGVGINLTAASNAFLMDPWWNPAVEEQAIMRIHRIGQTNRVQVKRFIVKGFRGRKNAAGASSKAAHDCGGSY